MDSIRIKFESLILIGLVPPFLIFYLSSTSGVLFFTVLALIWTSILFFLKRLGGFFPHFQPKRTGLSNLLLLVTSVMVALILIESFLWICQLKPQIPQRIAMPQEWKKRRVEIPGASYAYYWHNVLHVHDRNHMRRTTPFAPKSDSRFRIMIVGDSLTYGYGVREEETYPRQIETMLKKNFSVEVLNLGVSGYQSEDVSKTVKEYTPLLQPDLIIYGVCLNDFLPSGVGQYQNNMNYAFPLPEVIKRFMLEKTLLGRLVSDAYNYVLMKLGLRNDFYTDILKDFKSYQTRFARDVKDMNHFVLDRRLPPIVALVLNQFPDLHSKGYQIAMVAEQHLKNAGMTVIPSEEFYKKYDKQLMAVSQWEGHPNAEAHKIFAEFLVAHLRQRSDLEKFKIME
jgi:lysophospholipase L1-like esterase